MDLVGRRVLLTGGSRGLGVPVAEASAATGAHLVLVARSAAPLGDLARRLGGTALVADFRQALPGMRARGRGHVVTMSSLAAVGTLPGLAAYGSSKAGLTRLAAGLRADLRGTGIGVTDVQLGPVHGDMFDRAGPTRRPAEASPGLAGYGCCALSTRTRSRAPPLPPCSPGEVTSGCRTGPRSPVPGRRRRSGWSSCCSPT